MDKYDCTCGGLNGNCFRCFGTGLVESSVPIVGRPHRVLAPNPNSPAPGKRGRKQKSTMKRELTATSRQDATARFVRGGNEQQGEQSTHLCPVCKKQMLTMGALRSHIVRDHGGKFLDGQSQRATVDRATKGQLVKRTSTTDAFMPNTKPSRPKPKPETSKQRARPVGAAKDDIDMLDHPSRYFGSYGSGKRR